MPKSKLGYLKSAYKTGKKIYPYAKTAYNIYKKRTNKKKPTIRKRRRRTRYSTIRRKRARNFSGRQINIKNDQDIQTKTFCKNRVTKSQQRKINNRMKNLPSPFIYRVQEQITETTPQMTNRCKWLWYCRMDKNRLNSCWNNWIAPTGTTTQASSVSVNSDNQYVVNQRQEIYFNDVKTVYEIYNPTNYDMNVVIYDITLKKKTLRKVDVGWVAYSGHNISDPLIDYTSSSNPIALMQQGVNISARKDNTSYVAVQDSDTTSIQNIQFNPTDSQPFNIYWKIVGKKVLRLQPGATMKHKFTYKMKNLMNRGYWGYYCQDGNNTVDIGFPEYTCGSLFKVWGQISGDTDNATNTSSVLVQSNPTHVANLSGRIMIKSFLEARHYCIQPRAQYIQSVTNAWNPTDEEDLVVVEDSYFQRVDDDYVQDDSGPND